MIENDTFSLWLIPAGQAYSLLSGYITQLSEAYNLPKFEPHVTVLGGMRQPETFAMRALAGSLASFRVRLMEQVQYMDEFTRCLFLPVHQTPALMESYAKACEHLDCPAGPYFPHLSLAYGDLPVETKHAMIQDLGEIPLVEFEARAISLVQASAKMDVSSWQVIEQFSFGKT
jgi:2'-5' RNA ligase